ncbi:nucleoside hydrolase [Fodinicola feengrottensis]|uniref:Nucleoside hydrolase n=1 Tax=Fodinicola feengrottensis TaxID=435914 RepID=A0ABN2FZS5_9ACTN|nr:nucleoside hydrolase [Fodinicola feengrottensis]
MAQRLILDTDIGSDVDDALALGVILGSPEVELQAVTTVYGDTGVRARLASRLVKLAGRADSGPVIIPGETQTLSGRPVWWAGHEGKLFDDLDIEEVETGISAPDYLVQAVAEKPGEIDILAIAPLTNIALALRQDPGFAKNVRRIHMMGGDFAASGRRAEHNMKCDVTAAVEVFTSGIPITVVGLDITTTLQLDASAVAEIAASGPLGGALEREIGQWWAFHGHEWNNPHDPIAALTVISPSLFETRRADVMIAPEGDEAGGTWETPSDSGIVEVVSSMDRDEVARAIVRRIAVNGAGG